MRTTTKILLPIVLFMLTAAIRCGGGSTLPGPPTTCQEPRFGDPCLWPKFSSYDVRFADGTLRTFATGINGCIIYSARNGDCGIVVRYPNSFGFNLTPDPGSINLPAPPSFGNISGPGGFSASYGMPAVEYYDQYGYFVGGVTATAVNDEGTWLQAPQPDMSNIYSGNYTIVVSNADGQTVGTANVNTWGRDRPDSDGDGWYDDEDCYPYDPSRVLCGEPEPYEDPCYSGTDDKYGTTETAPRITCDAY